MTARLLLFVKHRLPFLWAVVEWLNARLYRLVHGNRVAANANECLDEFTLSGYDFRWLQRDNLPALHELLERQGPERLRYFRPHGFDTASLDRAWSNPSFLMFGVFHGDRLVGYFFLRCFWNRRCFVGRLIDEPYEGQGIGRVMNRVMYHTAWRSGFRCMTTVSRDNVSVMRSHANNPAFEVVQELPNNYLLVEFVRSTKDKQTAE